VSDSLKNALSKALTAVTRDYVRAKAAAGRNQLSSYQIERLREKQDRKEEIRAVAFHVMKQAYILASDDGKLPATQRQVMYAARPLVLAITGGKCWKESAYFTQTLLPDYLESNSEETAKWDVVSDARGHAVEPHTGRRLGLGTSEVRDYIASWTDGKPIKDAKDAKVAIPRSLYPTKGPRNRFNFAIFIEKEGFDPLLERSQIAEKYDVEFFSSKGMSVIAARRLVDELSQAGVTILVVHDFDRAGLIIAHTLSSDSRRYRFEAEPNVIDLGLRLADVEAMNLQSEPVTYNQQKNPGDVLLDYDDVSAAEIDFLVGAKGYKSWTGKRVELNAMTSAQFIEWLERKLVEHGVTKVVPSADVLASAWHRARKQATINRLIAQVPPDTSAVPSDLEHRVRELLVEQPELAWDEAVMQLAGRE
jgi:hypothetical protein